MREAGRLLLINLGIALLLVFFYFLNARTFFWENARIIFAISFTFATITGGLAWLVLPRLAPRLQGSKLWVWTQLLALLGCIGVVGGSVGFFLLMNNPFVPLRLSYYPSLSANVFFTLIIGIVSIVTEQARRKLEATTLELRTREYEREKALKAAAEAKLQNLESRIHPHFLFNTLNSIASLVRQDPALAERLIENLSGLLRYSLDRHGHRVRLADEVQITEDYLQIEKARFGDRLRYEMAIPEELFAVEVPALGLQTLVENSVKYAVGASRQGAWIRVTARRTTDGLLLEVRDDGPGFNLDSLPAGHGLDTLRQRLVALFGPAASLSTEKLEPGVAVRMALPC
ncbi:MAG: histidine kinase [Bryobacter sp.]|nr:histidine kinase [Bryobacter sp.]